MHELRKNAAVLVRLSVLGFMTCFQVSTLNLTGIVLYLICSFTVLILHLQQWTSHVLCCIGEENVL